MELPQLPVTVVAAIVTAIHFAGAIPAPWVAPCDPFDFLFSGEWWIALFPALALVILSLAVNLLGDWLRDALNPKLR